MSELASKVVIDGDRIDFPGIAMGPLELVHHDARRKVLVIRVKGHKYFGGIGRQNYAPAKMEVIRYSGDGEAHPRGGRAYESEFITSWEPGAKRVYRS